MDYEGEILYILNFILVNCIFFMRVVDDSFGYKLVCLFF